MVCTSICKWNQASPRQKGSRRFRYRRLYLPVLFFLSSSLSFFWMCLNGSMSNFHNSDQKSISIYSFHNAWKSICVEAWRLRSVISASVWWRARGCLDRGGYMLPTFTGMWYCGIFPSEQFTTVSSAWGAGREWKQRGVHTIGDEMSYSSTDRARV